MAAGVVDGAIIVDTGIKNDKAKVGAKDFINMVDQMANAVNKVGQQMSGSVNGYILAMNRARSAAKALTGDQAAVAKEILSTTNAIKKLEERQELAQRKWEAAREDAIAKASEEFQANNSGMELLPWEDEAKAAEQYAEAMQAVINSVIEKFGEFEDTAAFRNTSAEIEFLTEKLEAMKAQLAAVQQQEQQTGAGAAEQSGQVAGNIQETEEAAQRAHPVLAALKNAASEGVSGFIRLTGAAARAGASIAKIAGGGALSFLRKLAEGARNAAIQLAKLSGRAITSGFKTLGHGILAAGKWMLGLKSSTQQANGGFKRGLMTILKYGLGIRSLYFLFRKLRTAVVDSFNELAKHDNRTKNSINSLKTALAGLKGSLATAFSPIFNAVAPALTRLINMLTAAINAIGAFMAALTGQNTYQKAVANLGAASDAASGAGSAASDAADDYKDLKRELAGFDDLDILGSKDSSSGSGSSGGGGGGGSGNGFSYVTEEIGSGVTDFIGKLKEMWENADYEGIGRTIAGVINNAFETAKGLISWDNLGDKITEAVNAITGIFNGLVDGIDWTLIGETFGEGINTIIRTVNLLLTGIDWENLGKGFADGLNGLVDTISWSELGQMFSNKLNALIRTIKGVVSNFSWGDAGTAFATAVAGLAGNIDWTTLSDALTAGIDGAIEFLTNAVQDFSWAQETTKKFIGTINNLATVPAWDTLGATLANLLNGAFDVLKTAVTDFAWTDVAKKFVGTINNLATIPAWDTLGATLGQLISGSFDGLFTVVSAFEWGQAGKKFQAAVANLVAKVDWDVLGATLAALLNGALDFLNGAVGDFAWAQEAVRKFVGGVNNLVAKVDWDGLGTTLAKLINGSLNTLAAGISSFDWGDNAKKFIGAVNNLVAKVDWGALGRTLAALLGEAFDVLREAVSEFDWGESATSFAETVNGFFSNENLWSDAGTIVSNAIKDLFTWGKDFLDNLNVRQISNDIKIFLKDVDWHGIAKAIWDFLVSAFHALGSLLVELLTGGMTEEESQKAQQQVRDYIMGVVPEDLERDFSINWGLNFDYPSDVDAFIQLADAIEEGLKSGEFNVPVGLDVPQETIDAAYQTFVEEWNKLHPEAPIDPTLPPKSGEKVQAAWNKQNTELDTNVNPDLPSDAGAKVKNLWDEQHPDLEADVKANLSNTPAPNSATLATVFGSVVPVLAWLSGKDPDSKRYTKNEPGSNAYLFPYYFSVWAWLSGRDPDSKRYTKNEPGSNAYLFPYYFSVWAWLSGKDPDSKPYTGSGGLFKEYFKVLAYLSGKDPDSKPYTGSGGLFKESFKVLSELTGRVSGSKKVEDVYDTTITVKATLSDSIGNLSGWIKKIANALSEAISKITGKSKGGAITAGGREIDFASGGVIRGGVARYLSKVPHYAGGTTRAHGTVFVAGENGPEIMGHINGRTEILNKSQLAQAIYGAVVSGMGQAVNALGSFLANQMAACANAITETIGNVGGIAGLRGLEYHAPVMATGSVLPYEVSAQIAKTGEDIQDTLNANNEDLIQTIISVAGQIVAAVQATGRSNAANNGAGGLTVQQVIRQINRSTQMFGASPLLD